ncbi:Uncharacterized protein ALO64_03144 [Pseudomonas meliae]|uniref:DUF2132 domain-containing protein n=2 Tax=Pseudomonas meliae TaxID=86176 RepID=A0A0P9UKE7_9PSED|nr:Uncharacterized protein ALO64_03144 [Pseudomonas meliae]
MDHCKVGNSGSSRLCFMKARRLQWQTFREDLRAPGSCSGCYPSSSASRLIMTTPNSDPLHGVTLEQILRALFEHYEWSGMAERIDIRCFKSDPSIKSSLTFLRKTPWAREKVEALYVKLHRGKGW